MGINDKFGGQIGFGQGLQNSIRFISRVDDRGFECLFTAQDKTIRHNRPDGQCLDNQISLLMQQFTDD